MKTEEMNKDEIIEEEVFDDYSDEMYQKEMDAYWEWKEGRRKHYVELFEQYRKDMLGDLDEDSFEELFAQEFDSDIYLDIAHVGYGTAEVDENYHNGFYPNYRFFKFTDIECDKDYDVRDVEAIKSLHFMEQNMSEVDLKELVYQMTGPCGDDYSGYICWPMKDGRWWICEYEM